MGGDNRGAVTERRSTQPAIGWRKADPTNITPTSKREFVDVVTPALALVAPGSMTGDDRKAWFASAYIALDGLPVDLLDRGVRAAMRRADHPAKIVPAILAEVQSAWDLRRRNVANAKPIALPKPVETEEQREERLEVSKLLRGLVRKLEANA